MKRDQEPGEPGEKRCGCDPDVEALSEDVVCEVDLHRLQRKADGAVEGDVEREDGAVGHLSPVAARNRSRTRQAAASQIDSYRNIGWKVE